jgi:hypothetical protein
VMSLDALTLPDRSVDAAVSQFGFLQEGDVTVSARELSRVLKEDTPFSVAAFDKMELNTLFSCAALVLQRHAPAELLPDFDYLTGPGAGDGRVGAGGQREDRFAAVVAGPGWCGWAGGVGAGRARGA